MRTFYGAWPALVTPFSADDRVNVTVLEALTDYLMDRGVAGFYLCGSTGQGVHMSVAERKLTVETVLAQTGRRTPVIVHVGSQVMAEAIELARHAQATGAAGISSIIPAGYSDPEAIARYFTILAGAVPELPFLPYLFGGSVADPVALLARLADLPNLAGTKYTGPNMFQFRQIVEARSDSWSAFSGMDEQCLFAAMFGSCGNIGSTLNVIPGIYQEMHDCCRHSDLMRGRDYQLRANRITEILFNYGFHGALRVALWLLGFDCGQPRLPAQLFSPAKRDAFRADLEAADFFEIAAM